MNDAYLLTMICVSDNSVQTTLCPTDQDLGDFINHYDDKQYRIDQIERVVEFNLDFRDFFKGRGSLEYGG